ncbi:hypothetical protein F8M41_003871 [Gigaspora margarita]|uniref:Uncharacterized protein n=1 Tax=Gigaspora margarita TaxID=4874 RepID=A0A8H3XC42_GIGMA|nr:hypothetical protein F8M41_003871 [Gigaspora margarita]
MAKDQKYQNQFTSKTPKNKRNTTRQITRNAKGPEEDQRQFTSKMPKNKRNTTRQFTRNAEGPEEVPKTI